jgi:hypothetical protein
MRGKAQLTISRIQELKELPVKTGGSGFETIFKLPDWDYKKAQDHFKNASLCLMAYR